MKVDRGQPAELVVSLESPLPELVRREREREGKRKEGRREEGCALFSRQSASRSRTLNGTRSAFRH